MICSLSLYFLQFQDDMSVYVIPRYLFFLVICIPWIAGLVSDEMWRNSQSLFPAMFLLFLHLSFPIKCSTTPFLIVPQVSITLYIFLKKIILLFSVLNTSVEISSCSVIQPSAVSRLLISLPHTFYISSFISSISLGFFIFFPLPYLQYLCVLACCLLFPFQSLLY